MKKSLVCSLMLLLGLMACTSSQEKAKEVIPYESGKPYTRWWWFASEPDTMDIKYQNILVLLIHTFQHMIILEQLNLET